ncbi:MAG TPA: biotin/lipoyl-binding protein, partial [Aquaticitalea sp.]|nr:biotin/lipoyl-binding protein [Aquaticitalea sp.]
MKKTMKTNLYAAAIIALFLASCKEAPQQAAQQSALPFKVSAVTPKSVTSYTAYPTTIQGAINSEVRAKVSGYIQKVLVDEGQKVRKGQPLFKLETQSLSQDAEAAKARVNVAKVEVEKLKPLVEKNIISAVQLQTAKANLAQAESNYNSIVANIGYATV